jgi:hypothetical protein
LRQQQAQIEELECESVEILDIGGETMMKRRVIGSLGLVWMIAFVLLAYPVAGRLVVVTTVHGQTSVDGGCDAQTSGAVPQLMDVSNGDDLRYYYDVSWSDTRQSGSPKAYHNFTLILAYNRSVGDQYAWKNVQTTGTQGGSGSDTLSLTIYQVQLPADVFVHWFANITVPGVCSDSDYRGGSTHFY